MSNLPSIYKEEIKKAKQHNKKYCYVKNKGNVLEQLDQIFNNNDPIYKRQLLIETKSKTYNTRIIERNEESIITMNKETIPIKEIENIKKIS